MEALTTIPCVRARFNQLLLLKLLVFFFDTNETETSLQIQIQSKLHQMYLALPIQEQG